MPEPPDFDKLALAAIDASFDDPSQVFSFPKDVTRCQRAIVEQLRQVYQRGLEDAADVVDDALRLPAGAGFTRGQISDAIRARGGLPAKWTAKSDA